MPHVIIDYSRGAGDRVAMDALTAAVHCCIPDAGIVERKAVRTLAREASFSCVGDEHPDNQFIQIIIRMAPGRPLETKQKLLKAVFDEARAAAAPALTEGRLGLRVDLYESDPTLAFQESTLA
ncbi:5-carboxymethyl-2-hydroxymuconate isomerase [Neorhizobium sp. IRAMC:178]|uniref:5-carboxymethyl-2-hydroxymuconate isomerase n=1 Tax=Neorhizobium tunisiense TaxID=3144793 RepID=UPI0031F6D2EC